MVRLAALLALVALGCNAGPLDVMDAMTWRTVDRAAYCDPPSNGANFCPELMALGGDRGVSATPAVRIGDCVAPVGPGFTVAPASCDVTVMRDGRAYTVRLVLVGDLVVREPGSVTLRTAWRVEVPATDLNPNRGTGGIQVHTDMSPAE